MNRVVEAEPILRVISLLQCPKPFQAPALIPVHCLNGLITIGIIKISRDVTTTNITRVPDRSGLVAIFCRNGIVCGRRRIDRRERPENSEFDRLPVERREQERNHIHKDVIVAISVSGAGWIDGSHALLSIVFKLPDSTIKNWVPRKELSEEVVDLAVGSDVIFFQSKGK